MPSVSRMTRLIIGRVAVVVAAVAATITGAVGTSRAEAEVWFYVGDYPALGTPYDVFCQIGIGKAQCYPNQPTYSVPGERPTTCMSTSAASVYLAGAASLGYVCRADAGSGISKWQPGDYKRVGRFVCAVSDASGVVSVACTRDDGSGNSFEVARTWYRLSDGS